MGEKVRCGVIGSLLSFLLLGCAGFSYRYYGLEGADYSRGTLLGKEPADDLSFTICEPTFFVKHPCIVIKASEFYKMKLDYEDTIQKLKECQSGRPGD